MVGATYIPVDPSVLDADTTAVFKPSSGQRNIPYRVEIWPSILEQNIFIAWFRPSPSRRQRAPDVEAILILVPFFRLFPFDCLTTHKMSPKSPSGVVLPIRRSFQALVR